MSKRISGLISFLFLVVSVWESWVPSGLTDGNREPFHCGYIYLAFSVGGKGRVDEVTRNLQEADYEVFSGPLITNDDYYESCIFDPEDNLIEITEECLFCKGNRGNQVTGVDRKHWTG